MSSTGQGVCGGCGRPDAPFHPRLGAFVHDRCPLSAMDAWRAQVAEAPPSKDAWYICTRCGAKAVTLAMNHERPGRCYRCGSTWYKAWIMGFGSPPFDPYQESVQGGGHLDPDADYDDYLLGEEGFILGDVGDR